MTPAAAGTAPVSLLSLLRLIGGHVCLHGSMAGMRLAAPLLALRQGQSPWAVGILLALFALTQVFLAIPAGRFVDRHGLRRPMAISVVAASAGALLGALFPVFEVLCFAALLLGGATGLAGIALQRHIGRMAGDVSELKKVFAWLAIGPAISNFLGPVLAGVAIDAAGAWLSGSSITVPGFRAAFLLMGLLPLLTWWCLHNAVELPAVPSPPDAAHTSAWHLLREPRMRQLLLVNWMLSSCWDVHTFAVPVLGHERGPSASVIGTILGGFAVAAALVRFVIPVLAAHLREWVVVAGAMLMTSCLFALYPFAHSAWSMGLCSVLLGFSLGSVQPMIMSTLHQITPEHAHGQAIGLRMMAINLSSVLMPMLFGTAGAVVGVSVVFWTVGAVVGLGARGGWRLRV